jgi:hypothetical protein
MPFERARKCPEAIRAAIALIRDWVSDAGGAE